MRRRRDEQGSHDGRGGDPSILPAATHLSPRRPTAPRAYPLTAGSRCDDSHRGFRSAGAPPRIAGNAI